MVDYHGLGCRYLCSHRLLMRPQLNGGTLDGRHDHMGTYNRIAAHMTCPRCTASVEVEIDVHFGSTASMLTLEIGDRYPFHEGRMPHNGGPVEGLVDGVGYTECPMCNRDFFCAVEIRDGRLKAVAPSQAVPPYGPDHIREPAGACPSCGGLETRHFQYDRMDVGWFLCDSVACAHKVTTLDRTKGLYIGENVAVPAVPSAAYPGLAGDKSH